MNWHRPPICSKKWADVWSVLFFLALFFTLGYFDSWGRDLPLALGLALALRQFLRSRLIDVVITLIIFVPLFIFIRFHAGWAILIPMPFLFVAAGALLICREIFQEWRDYQKNQIGKQ